MAETSQKHVIKSKFNLIVEHYHSCLKKQDKRVEILVCFHHFNIQWQQQRVIDENKNSQASLHVYLGGERYFECFFAKGGNTKKITTDPFFQMTIRLFPHSCILTRVTQRLSLVDKNILTLQEHLSSPPVFIGIRFAWSFVFLIIIVTTFV
jgi:hypothetical protein